MGVLQDSNTVLSSHSFCQNEKKETDQSVQLFPNLRILKAPNPHSHALRLLEILEKCHQMA